MARRVPSKSRVSAARKSSSGVKRSRGKSGAGGKKTSTAKKNAGSKSRGSDWDDHYTRKAKKDNYPARSVYKLEEIQNRFKIIRKGHRILDLGCAPGSWLIYAAKTAGPGGFVAGIDLKPVDAKIPSNSTTHVGDILDLESQVSLDIGNEYNIVLSDMAPATTGRKDLDSYRSFELCKMALECASLRLVSGGAFVCKIFQGEEFKAYTDSVRAVFRTVKIFKPESCRKSSKEIYIIGTGKKQEVDNVRT